MTHLTIGPAVIAPDLIAQCVMCLRTAAAQQAERAHVLNTGTLILLVPPVIIGACLFTLARRKK